MKNKKGLQMVQMKRELAQLLDSGQDRTSRIRVEHLIREEKMVAAYELIEIYCELIAARLPIIESQKNCPIDLKEAIASVIFASPRCSDIPELTDVKKHFTAKYGKEFITAALELRPNSGVARMVVEKLSAVAPDVQTKSKVLNAIAEEHNIKWDSKSFEEKESKPAEDLLNGPSSFEKAGEMLAVSKIQVPNVQATSSYDKPVGQVNFSESNSRSSLNTPKYSSADPGVLNTNTGFNPDLRSSGSWAERMEYRQSFGRDDAYSDRKHWDIELKDATSAAHAAAEAAERASMAARAAAELSTREDITRRYSTESQKLKRHDLEGYYAAGNGELALEVEHLIREEKMVAAYELIEIYCELIAARLPIIESQKNCPIDLKEAIASVIFASPRCSDIPELTDVKKHFTAKYGKEFITAALELRPNSGVARMVVEKLSAVAPDVQTKSKVLNAIEEEHNIKWDSKSFEEKESKPAEDLLYRTIPEKQDRRMLRRTFPAILSPASILTVIILSFLLQIGQSNVNSQEVTCSTTCVAQNCNTIGIRYGKYCGVGWSGCPGEKPCDDLDACCKVHDDCVGQKGMNNVKCHEKFKRCIKKVQKSGKPGFSTVCPVDMVVPTMDQGMDMAIMFSQFGNSKLEL